MSSTQDILKKMKQKTSQENTNQNSSAVPTMKLQPNQKIKVKILRDTKTDKSQDPFKINIIHTQVLAKKIQCNFLFDANCPLCDLNNDKEWNDMRWNEYRNGSKDLWKLMMNVQSKWVSALLVVPVEEIYKTNPNKEIHMLYLWEQEVQDLAEQYVVLQDNLKENINKIYFYLTRIKTKAGYRLKIEPTDDSNSKLSLDRRKQIKKEMEGILPLSERAIIPKEPFSTPELYFYIIKPYVKSIQKQQEFLPEETYTKLMNIIDRVFHSYMIDESKVKKEDMDEMLTPMEPTKTKADIVKTTKEKTKEFIEKNFDTNETKNNSLFDEDIDDDF